MDQALPIENQIVIGDCRDTMRAWIAAGVQVQCAITSPPYWNLRDYKVTGQLGLEKTPAQYLENMVAVFELVRALLRPSGTLWLNMGDSYATTNSYSGDGGVMAGRKHAPARAGSIKCIPKGWKAKDMIGMPWRLAFALQDAGWYLRQEIIWHKPNPMPESAKDRCTKAHEHLFLLAKSRRYYFDADAIAEPVSPDTHMRAARGRSDDHKWADGGPGDHTLAKVPPNGGHYRGNGVGFGHGYDETPKPRAAGVNPKAKRVAGWATGSGDHKCLSYHQVGEHTKAGGPRPKQNESFSAALAGTELLVRNKRTVWTIPTQPYSEAHFATFPEALVAPCVMAGSRKGDIVFDPFMGSGTVAQVAQSLNRRYLGCDLNPDYAELQQKRTSQQALSL